MMTIAMALGAAPIEERINLAEFARVVQYIGDTPETLEVHRLERGEDGWDAWKGADGQYMIGLEWDEPRDVAEANVEFRHAIANREKLEVEYFHEHWPENGRGGWALLDDPFHGRWVAPNREWWAGDRDVTFAFGPFNQDRKDGEGPDMRFRRTYRLRFLLGNDELPPVRYIRAYGSSPVVEEAFEIRLAGDGPIKAPLSLSVVNGYLLTDDPATLDTQREVAEPPAAIDVRFAKGDITTPTRTIVTVRNAEDPTQGFSFLPAEVFERGEIRVPTLGVTVTRKGATVKPDAELRPGTSVFDRVETEPEQTFERARREIPELRKTAQLGRPMYLPLGPPDARQEIAVNYDGSIQLDRSALKVKAADSARLRWPGEFWAIRLGSGDPPFDQQREGNVKQRLLDDYLPIVINAWEHAGVRYEQTCAAGFLDEPAGEVRGDETVVLLSRFAMANTGSQAAHAVLRLAIEPAEILVLDGGHVLAKGTVRGDKSKTYESPRHRFALVGDGQVDAAFRRNADNDHDDVLEWKHALKPGETATLTLAVPFVTIDTDAEREKLAGLDFDTFVAHEADRWRGIIGRAARFEVPDPLLNDFYKAQLAHILITADRDPFNGTRILSAATHSYSVCLNESCHQIRSLDVRGLHDLAGPYLDAIIQGQSSYGLHGRFKSKEGALHGLPSKHGDYLHGSNYNLDHGFSLWMLNEHYRFTRDRAWLEKVAGSLIAACDFVTRESAAEPEANALDKDDTYWGEGMLPPGHLEDPPEWLWWFAVNAYAYRGMAATAESLAAIEHPEANRITADARAFGERLRRSCKESMIRAPVVRLADGTYVPHQPTRSRLRGRDLGWIRDALYGPVHLMDCGVYGDASPEAEWILRDAEDNVFIGDDRGRAVEDYDRQWFSWGGITLQSNLLPNPLIYLRRGQPKHAIRAFYNSLAANVYTDVRTFCEHPIKSYGIGQGPFFKSPDESAFIVWFRHLVIAENGDTLDLLPAVPAGWLEPGKEIHVERAATWFGPVDLHVVSREGPRRLEVRFAGATRNPPERIRLHARVPGPITSVEPQKGAVAGTDAEANLLTFPGNVGSFDLTVRY